MKTVFVVDDNEHINDLLTQALSTIKDVLVRGFRRPILALLAAQKNPPDVMVVDMLMPVMSGLELVRAARREGVESEVIFLTAASEATFDKLLPTNRVRCVMSKPTQINELRREVEAALAAPRSDNGKLRTSSHVVEEDK